MIDNIPSSLTTTFSDLINTSGKILGALVILLIGFIIAKIVKKFVKKSLDAIKIEKVGEKIREVDMFAKLDFRLSDLLSKVVFWLVFFLSLIVSTEVLDLPVISSGVGAIVAFLPKVLSALVIFIGGTFIANIIKNLITTTTQSMNIGAGKIIASIAFFFMVLIFAIMALSQIGMPTEIMEKVLVIVIVAFLGAVALGYGLSSKDLMANSVAGMYTKNKFKAGQTIKYKDIEGLVLNIDNNSAIIQKDSGSKIVIPLSKFLNEEIEILSEPEIVDLEDEN